MFQREKLLILALLVCDAAAGLASGLARGLALTAAAVLCAFAKVASFDGFDMLHDDYLQNMIYCIIISRFFLKVNKIPIFFKELFKDFQRNVWTERDIFVKI